MSGDMNKTLLSNDDIKIKKILIDTEDIVIPDEISSGIDEVLKDIEYKNKKSTKNILFKVAMIMAIVISITAITNLINPQLVRAMPVIGRIFDVFSGEDVGKVKEFSTLIDMTAKDKGIRVDFEEASIYGSRIMATFKVQGQALKSDYVDVEVRGKIYGEGVSPSSSDVKRVDNDTVVVLFEGNMPNINIRDEVELGFYIGGIIVDGREINGDWSFSKSIARDEIMIPSRKIQCLSQLQVDNYKFNIDEFETSHLGTSVNIKDSILNYDFSNKTEDDLLNDSSKLNNVVYIFRDSNGEILLSKDTDNSTYPKNMESFRKQEIVGDLSYSKYIDVIPVLIEKAEVTYYDENGQGYNQCINSINDENCKKVKIDNDYYNIDSEKSFLNINDIKDKDIAVNNLDTVTIKNVEVSNNYTKINVKINGYYDLRFLGFIELVDEDYNIYNGSSGVIIENSKDKEVSITMPAIDKSKKYTIALPRIMNLDINEENKIRVKLVE